MLARILTSGIVSGDYRGRSNPLQQIPDEGNMSTIELWPEASKESIGDENQGCPSLSVYPVHGKDLCPAVIVCPGGRYLRRAAHEGETVAKWLNGLGISAFVLNYRVSPYQHPIPLQDAQRAVRTVRNYAKDWNIDPEQVGIWAYPQAVTCIRNGHFV